MNSLSVSFRLILSPSVMILSFNISSVTRRWLISSIFPERELLLLDLVVWVRGVGGVGGVGAVAGVDGVAGRCAAGKSVLYKC